MPVAPDAQKAFDPGGRPSGSLRFLRVVVSGGSGVRAAHCNVTQFEGFDTSQYSH
jgi:hypothetical protein